MINAISLLVVIVSLIKSTVYSADENNHSKLHCHTTKHHAVYLDRLDLCHWQARNILAL